MRMKQANIGIAVVGAGRIGTLRARLAAKHPAVRFLAISDRDPARARALSEQAGADVYSGDNNEVISHPDVTAVIVSTPEQEHTLPILTALQLGKPVLVEKPIGFSLRDADRILDTLRATKGDLRVGYSRRYKECFLRAKEQMLHGRLGRVIGGTARVYNSRAQAFAILKRDAHATPVLDVLTYYVDLMCWFLEGNRPVEVVARGQHGIFKEAGYQAHDVTWAIVTFADGAVINLGVSYALPARYPTLGQSDRLELLGSEGTMIIDDDHMDHLLFSEKGIPHAYVPDHAVNMAFLGSNTAGDWAVGDFWGPLGNETRAWLDHLATGAPTVHTTPEQARINLETTIAIERAVASGQSVRLPLADGGLLIFVPLVTERIRELRPRAALLHIGAPRRHAELAPAHLRERRDALADGFVRGTGEAEPHPALAVALVGRPFRPGIDGDAARLRRLRQLQRVHDVGQLDPQEDAALGFLELGRGAELLGERLHQRVELGAQTPRQLRHMIVEMAGAEFGQHHLLQCAGAGVGLERQDARENLPRRHDVADPQRRRDRLGERTDMDDAGALAHGIDRGWAAAVPDQVGIAVVLEDRHAVLFRQLEQLETALLPHDGAGRVLHGRDGVDVFGVDAATRVAPRARPRAHPSASRRRRAECPRR